MTPELWKVIYGLFGKAMGEDCIVIQEAKREVYKYLLSRYDIKYDTGDVNLNSAYTGWEAGEETQTIC